MTTVKRPSVVSNSSMTNKNCAWRRRWEIRNVCVDAKCLATRISWLATEGIFCKNVVEDWMSYACLEGCSATCRTGLRRVDVWDAIWSFQLYMWSVTHAFRWRWHDGTHWVNIIGTSFTNSSSGVINAERNTSFFPQKTLMTFKNFANQLRREELEMDTAKRSMMDGTMSMVGALTGNKISWASSDWEACFFFLKKKKTRRKTTPHNENWLKSERSPGDVWKDVFGKTCCDFQLNLLCQNQSSGIDTTILRRVVWTTNRPTGTTPKKKFFGCLECWKFGHELSRKAILHLCLNLIWAWMIRIRGTDSNLGHVFSLCFSSNHFASNERSKNMLSSHKHQDCCWN